MTLQKAENKEVARRVDDFLPSVITKEQAAYLIKTIWPKAPETEVVKAAILCKQYGLNPLMKQVFLVKFDKWDDGKKVGEDWAIVLGIKASRQIAQQAMKRAGIRYSYADGPRAMTEAEQVAIFGKVNKANFWAITTLKDSQGNLYPGYGSWPVDKKPYGMDKGNDIFNMAFIRSERKALDKLAPGELPDIETGDDAYIEANYKVVLEKGAQQFNDRVQKDIDTLWGDDTQGQKRIENTGVIQSSDPAESAPSGASTPTDGNGHGEGYEAILTNGLNLEDVKTGLHDSQWNPKDLNLYLNKKFKPLTFKISKENLSDFEKLNREQAAEFAKVLELRKMK